MDQPIKFHCDYCDAEIEKPLAEAGTKTPCPGCKRIIRIPTPKVAKPKDWRDIAKKGPSGALANQPEELENAWGSIQKKNVSASALSQAGAFEEEAEPILLADWFKRGFWTAVLLGVGTLAFFVISRARTDKMQNDTIEAALEMIENKPNQSAKIKLSPLGSAEIHRAAGEFYCRQRLAVKARGQLQKALAHAVRADKKTASDDIDLFLIELALSQLDLGGSDEEAIAKERLYWPETLKELTPSLEAISEPRARSLGLRLVVSRLVEKKQAAWAIVLAGQLSSNNEPDGVNPKHASCLIAQQTALLFAQDNDKDVAQAKKLLPFPQTDNKEPIDSLARAAFVEGFVRQGKCKEALDLANATSAASDNLEAAQRLEACRRRRQCAHGSQPGQGFARRGFAFRPRRCPGVGQGQEPAKLDFAMDSLPAYPGRPSHGRGQRGQGFCQGARTRVPGLRPARYVPPENGQVYPTASCSRWPHTE